MRKRVPYSESKLHRKIQEKRENRENRKERIMRDLARYGDEILQSEEMQEAFEQIHHKWSTVGEHTLRVAFTSVLICYVLRKLKIKVNVPAVVVGSLCHDLGILGRADKYFSKKECHREHAKESVEVARELVDDLSEKAEDIIERHMWPMGKSKFPNSIEGAVVSVADKYTAVKDIIKGSDANGTGVKYFVRDEKEKIKDVIKSRKR